MGPRSSLPSAPLRRLPFCGVGKLFRALFPPIDGLPPVGYAPTPLRLLDCCCCLPDTILEFGTNTNVPQTRCCRDSTSSTLALCDSTIDYAAGLAKVVAG